MDFNFHDIPMPRPMSIILLTGTIVFHFLAKATHDEVNAWIATIAGICAIINYIITWLNRRNKKHQKSKPI